VIAAAVIVSGAGLWHSGFMPDAQACPLTGAVGADSWPRLSTAVTV
jgi:hypothetical protein